MKKLASILFAIVMVVAMAAPLAQTASAATVENVYPKWQTINGTTTVRCTWYAWQQAYDKLGIALPNWGNAINWLNRAASAGYSIGSVEKENSIAVWQSSAHSYGHVSYVTAVDGNFMTVNEGGMSDSNGNAANGTGIITNSKVSSIVGTKKSKYSYCTLLGFIYLNGSPSVKVTYTPTEEKNIISDTNAEVWCRVDKTIGVGLEKIGIRIRKGSENYSDEWHSQTPNSAREDSSWFTLSWNMNDELNLTLTHATQYYYQFYIKIGGKDYWSAEYSFTTTGSHTFTSWTEKTAATCTAQGTKTRKCSGCSTVETATIAALGHNYSTSWTTDTTATCTTAGSKSHHCTRCSAKSDITTIAATGHSYGAWATTKAATCLNIGTQKRTCSTCSATETKNVAALGHNYSSEWTVDKQAGCITEGSKSHHCTRCSVKSNITVISPTGHSFGEWQTVVEPTTSANGTAKRSCANCIATENKTIPALAADGHTHDFGEWKVTKEADCESAGTQERTCGICQVKEIQEISVKAHEFGEWATKTATTEQAEGLEERKCAACEHIETREIPKLPETIPEEDQTQSDIPSDTSSTIPTVKDDSTESNTLLYVIIISAGIVLSAGIVSFTLLKIKKK